MRHAAVLVVEQDRRTALALQRQLTALGYDVCGSLNDAAQAAARARELRAEVVLMDLALAQGPEGIQYTQHLRASPVPLLIVLTSRRGRHALEPAQASLADGYLVVPCNAQDLQAVLQIALLRREGASPHDSEAERLRRLVDGVPVLLARLGSDGRYQFANRLHEKWFGIARERIAGRSLLEVLGPDCGKSLAQPFAHALAGQAVSLDYESGDPAGRHVQVSLVPDRSADGVNGVFFAAANVTARIAAQRALAQERDQLRAVLDAMGEAVIAVDAAERIQYMNPAAEAITQWTASEVSGLPVDEVLRFVESDSGRRIDSPSREALATGASAHLPPGASLLSRDGQEFSVEDLCTPMCDTHGAVVGAVLMVHSVAAHPTLSGPGAHDALTGLMNRRELERVIERQLRNARETHQQHALLCIDVDQLHEINESCGHHAGDELLRRVAATMLGKLRRSDLLARVGGDEFGVFMANCPLHRARQIAQTLAEAVRQAGFNWQGRLCSVGLSIGAVSTGQLGLDCAGLLAAAEAASTLAKDAGGDRVHVYQADGTGAPARGSEGDWATRIASALAHDRLQLFAQRVVPTDDPAGLTHCSYEILLRLEGNSGALLPPMAFLPAAERGRLMPQVDRWVIGHTLRALAPYLAASGPDGGEPSYSINLSGASLADEGLLDFIVAELERACVPAQRICFEVAEATVLSHLHQASLLAKGLKRVGCRFALDHFRSGVGAYAYLQDLPVDYVKIDGSFVKGMLSDRLDCAVVEGITRIGQALEIETVAEGTESAAILAGLKDLGVGHAQGYFIHRPELLRDVLEAQAGPSAGHHTLTRPGVDWAVDWHQN
jgi:diguanylate cyclase (GGDEF)-like protein/PAS domain S-box-containing protein